MILVSGANGVLGQPLCQRLSLQGIPFTTVSRSAGRSIQWDLTKPASNPILQQLVGIDTLIHCAPIWLLPMQLAGLQNAGIKRLIVFSSTSVLSKHRSADPLDQVLVKRLASAESALQSFCSQPAMALTILRPSMIYGYGRDQNIMQIASFIRRFGFMLLAGKAYGLRQPVHADDLVDAALAVRENPLCVGKIYDLAGAEALTYRTMVERIFVGLGKRSRIVSLPVWVYRVGLQLAAKLSRFSYTAQMADRMSQDLNYDFSLATQDFGFRPQPFLQNPERDLQVNSKVINE